MRALARNVVSGLRLFAFLPVEPSRFAASPRQVVWLSAITLGVWIGLDRLQVEAGAELDWFTVQQVVAVSALAAASLILIGPRPPGATTRWATAVASTLPFLLLFWVLLDRVVSEPAHATRLALLMSAAVVYRAQRVAAKTGSVVAVLRAVFVVACVRFLFLTMLDGVPEYWFVATTEEVAQESDDQRPSAEHELFRQPDLIDAAVARVAPGTSGVTDIYFLGFAGYGLQRVFDKEVRFARDALAQRIDLAGRAIVLVNAADPDPETPFATVSGLRRALAGIATRMNLDEDVVVLFLTSHGAANAELSVAQGALPLDGLRAADLRQALDDAGIGWRIVVISACHSASFIPHLEDPRTLVATASRADRKALGCSDDRELTYFGEALFRDALPESEDWLGALARAREVVERHEREEKVVESERSEPQVFVGARMREKLAEIPFHRGIGSAP